MAELTELVAQLWRVSRLWNWLESSVPHSQDLILINSVIEASLGEIERRGLLLGQLMSRAFHLVDAGERDFDVLRSAILDFGGERAVLVSRRA